MANLNDLDDMYMDIAARVSKMSSAVRAKVGAVLVSDDNVVSYGWNGTPSGDDNSCEISDEAGQLITKQEVLHAESNCLMKLAANGGVGAQGATLYVTMSPCFECAKLIKQAKIRRVVFRELYRDTGGIDFLMKRGVKVEQLPVMAPAPIRPAPPESRVITESGRVISGPPPSSLLDQSVRTAVTSFRSLAAIAGKPAPVQGPSLFETSSVPPVQGPSIVETPAVPPIHGPTPNEPAIIDDLEGALAAAGITLVDGVPVERSAAPSGLQPVDDGTYRSSFT